MKERDYTGDVDQGDDEPGSATRGIAADERLMTMLRELRQEVSRKQKLPPYVIFHDATLREMAQVRPKSLRDMGLITGIGDRKLEAYGDAFLAILKQF